MNIAFVLWGSDHFGGMERRYVRLAEQLMLSFKNVKVFIFCDDKAVDQVKSFLSDSFWSSIVAFKFSKSISRFISLNKAMYYIKKQIKMKHITHVHLISNPGLLSLYILFFLNYRLHKSLVMVDSTYDVNSQFLCRIAGNFSIFFYNSVDCLSTQTRLILERSFLSIHRKKYYEAPCSFTDLDYVTSVSYPKEFDFVTMARFVPGKGYNLLESIFDSVKFLKFRCFGSGPNPPNIPAFYLSFTKAPFEVLSKSKIFLSLQEVNNYPSQSVLEAMSCGAVVVATDVGETRRFLDDNCAILIRNDPEELLNAINLLLSDDELRNKMARNARKRVCIEHTIERYAKYFAKYILCVDQ